MDAVPAACPPLTEPQLEGPPPQRICAVGRLAAGGIRRVVGRGEAAHGDAVLRGREAHAGRGRASKGQRGSRRLQWGETGAPQSVAEAAAGLSACCNYRLACATADARMGPSGSRPRGSTPSS